MEQGFGVSSPKQRKGLGLSSEHLGSPASHTGTSVSVMQVWEGHNVVHISRAMIGHTDSTEAAPGTIRGDFSVHISRYGDPDTFSLPMRGKEGQNLSGGGNTSF